MPTAPRQDPLTRYRQKRDFRITPEPDDADHGPGQAAKRAKRPARAAGTGAKTTAKASAQTLSFVIQKHWASHLHYDFRLELDGVLLSWAVPKGPSYDTKERRMAIHVEDHPLSYGGFEGTIPPKQYGAGEVIVWDNGTWTPEGDPHDGLRDGKLVFRLHGQKLAGLWQLIRTSRDASKREQWLLIKKHDGLERPHADYDVTLELPDSVIQRPLGKAKVDAEVMTATETAGSTEPDLSRAKKARLPAELTPQLATLVSATPPGDWIAEAKFDGYRLMARVDKGKVRLMTRGGNDWTARLPSLAEAITGLGIDNGWLDGEIVVLRDDGAPDFSLLQNAIGHPTRTRHEDIVYFLFDLPFLNGHDLREVPLIHRRAVLRALMEGHEDGDAGGHADGHADGRLRFSEDFAVPPEEMLAAACQMRLEGLILKRPDSGYVSARSEAWVKLKCQQRQEFVVVGFTDRSDGAKALGSLLLGYYEDGALRYAGRVGTGWSLKLAGEMHKQLAALEVKTPHFDEQTIARSHWARMSGRTGGDARWVKPKLVVEVAFAEWTPDGHVRHASFQGQREDKAPKDVGRESAKPAEELKVSKSPSSKSPKSSRSPKSPKSSEPTTSGALGQLRITHPERVIDPSTGHTKIELIRYYESVVEWMQPHLGRRPVAIVRAPDGVEGQLFFQKHVDGDELIVLRDPVALMQLTQMNAIEFHTWNAQDDKPARADRFIIDLDPGEGVAFPAVVDAARITRALLKELGLQAWLKTSGGKGLHVVVPLARRHDHATAKAFSQALVQHLAETFPKKFSAKSGPKNRVGKIFPDYLRNGEGQTTACAFTVRARPGLGVSMPIAWDELDDVKRGDQWTLANARDRLSFQKLDPWKDYWTTNQTLTAGLRLLGLK
ncbi:DNA ligase D [Mitsuaria sp. 7]|uniref:DNA ligase D n=1 Tax=Mitsuaria sp. 7 TaxID=1658665 RepID=UPI0007DD9715|nr:DNA ligase D [Mitsuaria sp. 7]ANH67199.1 ATP-dependent DNA ligase [Mitsuaria sp. 7]